MGMLMFLGPVFLHALLAASVNSVEKEELRLLVLLPKKSGQFKLPFGAEMSGSAVLSAFAEIRNSSLLPNYELEADFADTGCNALKGIGAAHQMLHARNYSAIIGLPCSQVCRVVARLAAFLDLPVFTGVCQDVEMLNKNEFRTLTRFLGTFEMTGFAVCDFMQRYGWGRVGIIAERQTDIIWLLTRNGLHYAMKERNIMVAMTTLLTDVTALENVLVKTAQVSRVIILAMHGDTFRETMVLAHKLGLHLGDYIFISIDYYKQRKLFGDFSWQHGTELDARVRQVFPAVFFFSYYNREQTQEYDQFIEGVKNGSKDTFGYHYGEDEEVPYPAANLYEATMLYARAVNESLRLEGHLVGGHQLATRLWNRTFPSLTGGLTLNQNGDREQAYMIRHLQDTTSGHVEVVGLYSSKNASLNMFPDHITWPGNRKSAPPDTPPCGYEGEFCTVGTQPTCPNPEKKGHFVSRNCTQYSWVAGPNYERAQLLRVVVIFSCTLVGVVLAAGLLTLFIYRRMKWEKDLAEMKWKVTYDDIILTKTMGFSSRLSQLSCISLKTADTNVTAHRFTVTGTYKGLVVALKKIGHISHVDLGNRDFLGEMKKIYDLSHPNLTKFVGASIDGPTIYILTEYCPKGSLQDLLENDDFQLDWAFKCSLMNDVLEGLIYLQNSHLHHHGNLKSSNCVVDSRFVVKLTDFGLRSWHMGPDAKAKDLLWTAPELLRSAAFSLPGDLRADMYSLGVIMHEIVTREGPFYSGEFHIDPEEIVKRVMAYETPSYRPSLDFTCTPASVVNIIDSCWHDNPQDRPTPAEVKLVVQKTSGTNGRNINIMDNLLSRMEQYANNLESLVEERTGKYLEEKKRAEDLLHRLLPSSVAEELQQGGHVAPVQYECVTIYFSDIVHFTQLCSNSSPMQVVDMLNDLYTMFDSTISRYDVYKVETIGDAYMVVSGLPRRNGTLHAREIALMSLALQKTVQDFKIRHCPGRKLQLRIGIHSGPCVSGVVGLTMPRYCLFGDTVNTAARMESNGEALKIHISSSTNDMLQAHGDFITECRGEITAKGKGTMTTYWLLGSISKF